MRVQSVRAMLAIAFLVATMTGCGAEGEMAAEPVELTMEVPDAGEPGEGEPPVLTMVPPEMTEEAPGPVDPAAIVARELAQLETGRILYNPPDQMRVAETERIEVRITRDMLAPLDEGLRGSGTPQEEEIPVATFMKVRLTGDNFDILPLSSEEQVIAGDLPTTWSWDVTPLASGDQSLAMVVTARVKLPGYADEQKDLQVIERLISVQVNPLYSLQSFVADNREWIYSAVLIPLVLSLGGWLWRRRERQNREGT